MNLHLWIVSLSVAGFTAGAPAVADMYHPLEPAAPAAKTAATAEPADHGAALHPESLQALVEAQGELLTLDPGQRTLQIKDTQGRVVTVRTLQNTRVLDSENHLLRLSELKLRDHLRVYYNREDYAAQQIDRLPSVTEAILGK